MKISNKTVGVLNNFKAINPSILIQAGKFIRTIDYDKTIFSSAEVEEEFPKDVAIYDLPNFLQVVKMFDGADIEFGDEDTNHCIISYDKTSQNIQYGYASPSAVPHIKKDIVMPETEINFILSKENLAKIMTAAVTMDLPHVLITPGKEGQIVLTTTTIDNPSSNTFKIILEADVSVDDFSVVIDFAKFVKLMEADYNVGISTQKISHFQNEEVQYWIALNAVTTFEDNA
jgi:hypothetical protein